MDVLDPKNIERKEVSVVFFKGVGRFIAIWGIQSVALVVTTFVYTGLFHSNIYWPFAPLSQSAGGTLDYVFVALFTLATLFLSLRARSVSRTTMTWIAYIFFGAALLVSNVVVVFLSGVFFIGESL